MNSFVRRDLVFLLPIIMLVLAELPVAMPAFFPLLLQIVVSVCAAVVVYMLWKSRPAYYWAWAIVFVLIVLIYNPIVSVPVSVGLGISMGLIVIAMFIACWWFAFKSRGVSGV